MKENIPIHAAILKSYLWLLSAKWQQDLNVKSNQNSYNRLNNVLKTLKV